MRVLLVIGAPRRTGYTRELADLFASGVEQEGGLLTRIDLDEVTIAPCLGCFGCWDSRHPGRCVQSDDMEALLGRYYDCEAIAFVTPVYFYTISARLKIFLERLLPITAPLLEQSARQGLWRNALRHPDKGPKGAVLIAAQAHRDTRPLQSLSENFELICEGLSIEQVGQLLRPETHFLDYEASKPLSIRKVRAAFAAAGQELVRHGRVSAETEAAAARPLTRNQAEFNERFTTYWQIAAETEAPAGDREQLRRIVAEDLRILLPEVAACLDPVTAGELEAIFQFELQGSQAGNWYLSVSEKSCTAHQGTHESPQVTVRGSSEVLIDVFLQRRDPRQVLAQGELTVAGERTLFARFPRLFPPPAR